MQSEPKAAELRNCTCGSTLTVLQDVETETTADSVRHPRL
jgi:hypothetical protein